MSLDMFPDAAVAHIVAAEDAKADTVRLREEEPPLGLLPSEAVCPACRLAQHEAGFSWGVCSDCLAEALGPLPS